MDVLKTDRPPAPGYAHRPCHRSYPKVDSMSGMLCFGDTSSMPYGSPVRGGTYEVFPGVQILGERPERLFISIPHFASSVSWLTREPVTVFCGPPPLVTAQGKVEHRWLRVSDTKNNPESPSRSPSRGMSRRSLSPIVQHHRPGRPPPHPLALQTAADRTSHRHAMDPSPHGAQKRIRRDDPPLVVS